MVVLKIYFAVELVVENMQQKTRKNIVKNVVLSCQKIKENIAVMNARKSIKPKHIFANIAGKALNQQLKNNIVAKSANIQKTDLLLKLKSVNTVEMNSKLSLKNLKSIVLTIAKEKWTIYIVKLFLKREKSCLNPMAKLKQILL